MDFLLTETEKCDLRFPYKSTGCDALHRFVCPSMGTMMSFCKVINVYVFLFPASGFTAKPQRT